MRSDSFYYFNVFESARHCSIAPCRHATDFDAKDIHYCQKTVASFTSDSGILTKTFFEGIKIMKLQKFSYYCWHNIKAENNEKTLHSFTIPLWCCCIIG